MEFNVFYDFSQFFADESSSNDLAITLGILIPVLLIAILATFFWRRQQQLKKAALNNNSKDKEPDASGSFKQSVNSLSGQSLLNFDNMAT